NTQIIDTCIVFPQWHIRSHTSFVLSFFAIIALGVFYEWLRAFARRVDKSVARSIVSSDAAAKGKTRVVSGRRSPPLGHAHGDDDADEGAGLLSGVSLNGKAVPPFSRALRAVLYGATVFLSFFLMLVFMTYNAYLILAVVLGASLGHYYLNANMDADAVLFGGSGNDKGMACH
ncbi:Ctr copper transporter, partial [Fomitiporia mediterranea MF3/22]|uniref:Ctr copper transporter n=1 Tax=Fomitiporia mediterranea (strain MF3/22) TaxID=694068 RepID=UPI00044090F3